jgi:ribose transport system ATP-binding protein
MNDPRRRLSGGGTMTVQAAQGVPASLRVTNLSKWFAGTAALSGVDISIKPGRIHALLGENGSGKSTLIKILTGYHTPDTGEVFIAGSRLSFGSAESSYRLGCRVVHQDLGLVDTSSILDNMSLTAGFATRLGTVRRRESRRAAEEALARIGLKLDVARPVGMLSQALKTGVALARAFRDDPRSPAHLLILDEPTATLPHDEVDQLLGIIRDIAQHGVGVLYVSHRLAEVRRLADDVTILRDGRRVATGTAADLGDREIVHLLTDGKLGEQVLVPAFPAAAAARGVLKVRNLASGGLADFSVEAGAGEVVGIAGLTGSGREVLLASIFGAVHRENGEVTVDGRLVTPSRPDLSMAAGVAYLPPDRKVHGGIMTLSAKDNISISDLTPFRRVLRLNRRAEAREARHWFDTLAIRPAGGLTKSLERFSGGNQQKVLFAKWLRRAPKVLLLDEPTQGVDIAAKAELHRQIAKTASEGTAVVVSSADIEELIAVSHRILIVRAGRVVASLSGEEATINNVTRQTLGGELEVS